LKKLFEKNFLRLIRSLFLYYGMSIYSKVFGRLKTGGVARLFCLTSDPESGVQINITNYGGIITSVMTKDRDGNVDDIVLGLDNLQQYEEKNNWYFGCITGRFANRIGDGKFMLDGQQYNLAQNNGSAHLHGGLVGFNRKLWAAKEFDLGDSRGVVLMYESPSGEEGYPGRLNVSVTYTLDNWGVLDIYYEARTDESTVLNLTNHSYFNLSGQHDRQILDHELSLASSSYTPYDENCVPTGEIWKTEGTPMDFCNPKVIGRDIDADYEQLKLGRGFDHNFIVDGEVGELRTCAKVLHPASGRTIEVLTTEPGVQLYTGNWMDGSKKGKGYTLGQRCGFCLETQHFPDSPNKPQFPTTVLRPGELFKSHTRFVFGVSETSSL